MSVFANAEVLCNRNYHFFLVSWVALSRTCNPKLRVSLVCLWSCASMCHGKCWHGTFPLSPLHALLQFLWLVYLLFTSHLFQRLGNALITDLFCIWSWLCEDHWILILLFASGDTAAVCVPRRPWMLLLCNCSLQSSALPWHSGLTSCLTCCWSHCQCCPKLPGLPESTEMWEKQSWKEKNVGRSSPRRMRVLPCTINSTKEAVWNLYSFISYMWRWCKTSPVLSRALKTLID